MLLTSAIASNSFSSGIQVLRAQMDASGGGEITVGGRRFVSHIVKRMVAFWRVGAITLSMLI